jgi:hypothetical protein
MPVNGIARSRALHQGASLDSPGCVLQHTRQARCSKRQQVLALNALTSLRGFDVGLLVTRTHLQNLLTNTTGYSLGTRSVDVSGVENLAEGRLYNKFVRCGVRYKD